MSELTLTVMRLGFLAVLWLFVIVAVQVIRSDLFGTRVNPRSSRRGGGGGAGGRAAGPGGAAPPPTCSGPPPRGRGPGGAPAHPGGPRATGARARSARCGWCCA
ncbi:hypothetical protein ACFVZ3_41595, partial [Kitasatospora purpeofusca]